MYYLRRFLSVTKAMTASRGILITDPALVKTPSETKSIFKGSDLGVRLRIPEGLFNKLVARPSDGEESFVFGKCLGPATLIGQHVSDSGMTCITEDPPYKTVSAEQEEEGFDWTEFVMTTLSSPEVTRDEEAFPILKWFSRIPLASSTAAVYAYSSTQTKEGLVFEGFIIKGL